MRTGSADNFPASSPRMAVQRRVSRPTRLGDRSRKGRSPPFWSIEHYLDGARGRRCPGVPQGLRDVDAGNAPLSDDDLMTLGARIRAYIALGKIGAIGHVATTERSHEQARMFAALAEADRRDQDLR